MMRNIMVSCFVTVAIFLVRIRNVHCWLSSTAERTNSIWRRSDYFHRSNLVLSAKNDEVSGHRNSIEDMDWRDVRAKLVMQYRQEHSEKNANPSSENTNSTASSSLTSSFTSSATVRKSSWAYESGDVIETGSLTVSHPSQDFSCGGLRQQYFYKSVVVVVEHDISTFTKGIILNRPTNKYIQDDRGRKWKLWFGGDVQGIDSDEESYVCFHRLSKKSVLAKDLSTPILQDIAMTPWEIAQLLVDAGEAIQDDFWLCCGYSGWAPGQLQDEKQRGNWFMVATDVESLWTMIGQDLTSPVGTDMWVQIMKRIGKEDLTTCMPDQKFKDDMLKQWVTQKLLRPSKMTISTKLSKPQEQKSKGKDIDRPSGKLRSGSLVRASSPILLDDQVFHQSLVLILQDDDDMTVGVVLNRPSSTSETIAGIKLPVRFGGRFGLEGKGKPQLWFHCNNAILQAAKIGEPVSDNKKTSTFWRCTKDDAELAVEKELAKAEDFIVVSGVSVWDKKGALFGGEPTSPIKLDTFFSDVDESGIDTVWKLLLAQEPLSKKNAAENLEAANAAWMLSGDASWILSGAKQFDHHNSDMSTQEQQKIQSLAYSALDKWIRLFLLKS